jgi:UNC-6/NTR/C345C module
MGAVSGTRLLLAALLSAPVALAVAAPANAACPPVTTLEERAAAAADVFTGTVADSSESGSTRTYTVTVGQVYKGSVSTEQVAVTTDTRPRACGLPALAPGDEYVFFVAESGDELTTGRRTGSWPATDAYVARVEAVLGSGHPAVPPPAPPAEEVTFETVGDQPAELSRVAAPGLALVLVGLLGFALASFRGRRHG